ncbi:sigma-54-dependent transcriptional regulator [Natronospira bacteriovora]|uniref:Sigma-54 dependent transcriptional regulator n=1 Tax=Natronospira bacteriovora TaxID=3069753 RepID=A0ABU0W7A8_9GAMM|nr:sigma-54 dependent transcriptional regulator [Natronospira sp. AB-CW4]MDQ2068880.1 sigma-54 dependent transcriptional regulator [Natronospira sp. AB-CW4]
MSDAPERILVVEDDPSLSRLMDEELSEAGHDVQCVDTAEKAVPVLKEWNPALVLSDLRLPGADGMNLLREARSVSVPPAFVILTAFGSIEQAVEALKAGADEFLTKPIDIDHLLLSTQRVLENRRLRTEVQRFREVFSGDDFHGMVGESPAMRQLYEEIQSVAVASGPVLVVGESGTGKELVARAIHQESDRRDGPFLAVNCAGIPADLLESEFFGHMAGAFTGAVKKHEGIFARADGGTLLLDEIGEMPMNLQAKLLRVLQEGVIRPVGGEADINVDVRIVAATNRDLEQGVADGDFREDLFYRMETFSLHVPPLRDRERDLEMLAIRFMRRFSLEQGRQINGFSDEALESLQAYPFPGNVRELQNAIERAVTFCRGDTVQREHLPTRLRNHRNTGGAEGQGVRAGLMEKLSTGQALPTLEELERRYIEHVLSQVDGNKRRAAGILGVSRQTLYRKLD